ncbi:tyrosine-type recombinase/integrase [Vagococcus luciliae]|uniref:Tyrosine recombinase XerC n=1 Tax=Vagococcus luciliae TaxID=2920380 RepID=A0ABY5P1Y9_9ENTE|nr:tyrosine-type recombinase/integrase [Vagococcus luciliae]UUV99920.1 Tyrosine recombinase XerC [Vagococcus luciliae]
MKKEFLSHLLIEGKTQSTVDEYDRRLHKFDLFLDDQELSIHEVTTQVIMSFRKQLLLESLSNRRINAILSTVHCYFNYLILHGEVKINPVLTSLSLPVKSTRKERLSDDELTILRLHIDSFRPNVRCAFLLMLSTGARVGEVAHLKKSDFFITNHMLYISITNAKWGSDRTIPIIDNEVSDIIQQYLAEIDVSSQPVFRVSKRTLQRHMTNFSNKTGIACHCHLLRHTFAAKLIEQGISIEIIKQFLGHKNINMTAHYTQSARLDLSQVQATIWQGN